MNTQKALELQRKIERLANLNASFRFRLGAILAADNRPGKVWD